MYRELGGCNAGPGVLVAENLDVPAFSDTTVSGQVDYGYRIRAVASSGECASGFSACVSAQAAGACTAPPSFAGLSEAVTGETTACRVKLAWPDASPNCTGPASYDVHRSTDAEFQPTPATRIAAGLPGNHYADEDVQPDQDYTYLVRARDQGNSSEDDNLVRLDVMPLGPPVDGSWMSGAEEGQPILNGGNEGPALRHVAWHVVDDVAHSGERSYYSGYVNGECIALTSAPLSITPGESAELHFHTRYGIEAGWDGGVVQLSDDGGDTWQTLTPTGGYPAAIENAGNACDLPVGAGVYGGTSLAWSEQHFSLSPFSGEVRLRWLFATDTGVVEDGWWIDDIVVSHVQVAGQCIALADDRLFAHGFESASTP